MAGVCISFNSFSFIFLKLFFDPNDNKTDTQKAVSKKGISCITLAVTGYITQARRDIFKLSVSIYLSSVYGKLFFNRLLVVALL